MSTLAGRTAVVVGAGFGGLAAAAHLAQEGAAVTVLERAPFVGGKAARLVSGGFSFDAGPTLLTFPAIVRETFAAAGADLDVVAKLTALSPIARYLLPASDGGGEIVIWPDHARTKASIARVSPEDALAWDGFFAASRAIWEAAGEPYLEAPFDGLARYTERVLRRGLRAVRLGATLGSLDGLARRHFRSPAMHKLVGRYATYAGASPFEASAAYAMILYAETAFGAHYPEGGMHVLAERLAEALVARGVTLRTGVEVEGILFDGEGRAVGVHTDDPAARRVEADVVVCDVDPETVGRRLLPEALRCRAGVGKPSTGPRSLSGLAWSFGIEGDVPEGAHHTVLFPEDYAEEFRAIFARGAIAADPTLYVSVPTLSDPSRAPPGHHVVFALVNAPARLDLDWDAEAQRVRRWMMETLDARFLPSFERLIRAEAVVTPRDIALTGAEHGAIYGIRAPHGALAPFERPRNRAPYATGLYFVGGGTHPGGGVPMVMRGGRFVRDLVVADAAHWCWQAAGSRGPGLGRRAS